MITTRQADILKFIWDWQSSHAYAPSNRDIQAALDISSNSVVAYNLRALREKGLVDYIDGEARTLHITGSYYILPTRARLEDLITAGWGTVRSEAANPTVGAVSAPATAPR